MIQQKMPCATACDASQARGRMADGGEGWCRGYGARDRVALYGRGLELEVQCSNLCKEDSIPSVLLVDMEKGTVAGKVNGIVSVGIHVRGRWDPANDGWVRDG